MLPWDWLPCKSYRRTELINRVFRKALLYHTVGDGRMDKPPNLALKVPPPYPPNFILGLATIHGWNHRSYSTEQDGINDIMITDSAAGSIPIPPVPERVVWVQSKWSIPRSSHEEQSFWRAIKLLVIDGVRHTARENKRSRAKTSDKTRKEHIIIIINLFLPSTSILRIISFAVCSCSCPSHTTPAGNPPSSIIDQRTRFLIPVMLLLGKQRTRQRKEHK